MLRPHRAKSRIVVLDNHKDCIWTKSEKYAPVLRPDTLRLIVSMAIQQRRTLKNKSTAKTPSVKVSFPQMK